MVRFGRGGAGAGGRWGEWVGEWVDFLGGGGEKGRRGRQDDATPLPGPVEKILHKRYLKVLTRTHDKSNLTMLHISSIRETLTGGFWKGLLQWRT